MSDVKAIWSTINRWVILTYSHSDANSFQNNFLTTFAPVASSRFQDFFSLVEEIEKQGATQDSSIHSSL